MKHSGAEWPDFKFGPINLYNCWPRYDQWWKFEEEWYE